MTTSATEPASSSAAPRVRPAALTIRVGKLLEQAAQPTGSDVGTGRAAGPVIVFRAAPVWDGDPEFTVGGRKVRVVPCVSPLAVIEQVSRHVDTAGGRDPDRSVLVLLTDRDESELGHGVLSQVLGHKVMSVDLWSVVSDSFGAQRVDARLLDADWVVEALVDAMPPGGWPRLSGSVLGRDAALRLLAARRLGLEQLGLGPDDLDARVLLRWSAHDGLVRAFGTLRDKERQGLVRWLIDQNGQAAKALFSLVDAGNGSDALPVGLVCAALWHPDAGGATERARGRVDRWFGDAQLDDATVTAFAEAAQDVVRSMLTRAGNHGVPGDIRRSDTALDTDGAISDHPDDGRIVLREEVLGVLDRAEDLLLHDAAEHAARFSDILRSAFEHRVGAVAAALHKCMGMDTPGVEARKALGDAVKALAAHQLAQPRVLTKFYADRVKQARMAQRLVRWLGDPSEPPVTVGDGLDRNLSEWGWVDLALDYVWAGDATHTELQDAYKQLYQQVRARRRTLDETFAPRLAEWTAGGSVPTTSTQPDQGILLVESVLERVVAPLARNAKRPTLLVVVDGMSAVVAVELAEQLRGQRWEEYDPLGGTDPEATPRRRAVAAALPTVTRVSRSSLLAGELREGDQSSEQSAFERHPLWRGHKVRLFHQAAARGGPGAQLSDELETSLSDLNTMVAVVLNTVDDALDHGRERAGAGWHVEDVGLLGTLLDHARYHGRAVVLTSDHGHVPERGGVKRPAREPVSARHRVGAEPAVEGEVELSGSRVIAPGNRVVALWDPDARYLPNRAGYHGGASLAEVTVPLLAFLPLGAEPPEGWRALTDQRPSWWSSRTDAAAGTEALSAPPPAAAPVSAGPRGRRKASKAAESAGQASLDLGVPAGASASAEAQSEPTAAPAGPVSLVDALMNSEMFQTQHKLTPRPVPEDKIRDTISALLDANGILPLTVIAERARVQPVRAKGFVTTLQRITNVDNYQVLSVEDDGRTVRLNERLLREQFDLGPG